MAIIASVFSYLGLTNLPFKLARKVTKEKIGQDDTKDKKDTKGSEEAEFCILKREVHVHEELEEVKEPKSIQDPASACFEDSDSPKTPVTEEDASDQMESQDLDPQEASNSVELCLHDKLEKMDASNVGRARNETTTQQKEKIDASNVGSNSSRRLFRKRQDFPTHILLLLICMISGANGQCAVGGDPKNPSSTLYENRVVEKGDSVIIAIIPDNLDPLPYSLKMDAYPPSIEYQCARTSDSLVEHNCSAVLWDKNSLNNCTELSLVPMGNNTGVRFSNITQDLSFCFFIEGPNYFCHSAISVVVRGEKPPVTCTTVYWWGYIYAFWILVPILALCLAVCVYYIYTREKKDGKYEALKKSRCFKCFCDA